MLLWPAIERILLTLWVGGMWAAGFLVAPRLFRVISDRMQAGEVAGEVFAAVSVLGLVCGGALLVLAIARGGHRWYRNWRLWLLAVMLAVVVVGQFWLAPAMRHLKVAAGGPMVEGATDYRRFATLHAVSTGLFAVNSLAGLALVVFGVTGGKHHRR